MKYMNTLWLLCVMLSCQADELPPIARIDISPAFLCEGDNQTEVIFDAGRSEGFEGTPIDLTYEWSFAIEPLQITSGDSHSEKLRAKFDGLNPIEATVAITDPEGRQAFRSRVVGLTLRRIFQCEQGLGCANHEECVPAIVNGESQNVCVGKKKCFSDKDCNKTNYKCLVCRPPDGISQQNGEGRCLPPL